MGYLTLLSSGLTNHETEDYGILVSSTNKHLYAYYCASQSCCLITTQFRDNKTGKLKIRNTQLNKVLKIKSHDHYEKCPDCKNNLFSERVK